MEPKALQIKNSILYQIIDYHLCLTALTASSLQAFHSTYKTRDFFGIHSLKHEVRTKQTRHLSPRNWYAELFGGMLY